MDKLSLASPHHPKFAESTLALSPWKHGAGNVVSRIVKDALGENVQIKEMSMRNDRYTIAHFTELTHPDKVEDAWRIHADGYISMGFIHPHARVGDVLPPDIDKARGSNVDYRIGTREESGEEATMRKVNIPEGGDLSALPAYVLCKDTLDPDFREMLESIEEPVRRVKEIAALSRTETTSPVAVFELLRDGYQQALGQDEIWFFSIVDKTFQTLVDNFGPYAIQQVGQSVTFQDDRIKESIALVPAVVVIDDFIDGIRVAIEEAEDLNARIRYTRSFLFFSEGLPDSRISEESRVLRGQLTGHTQ